MIISVWVKPGSKRAAAVTAPAASDDPWIITTPSKPIDGEANEAVIQLIATYFAVARREVTIKSGARSRRKLVEIKGL